MVPFQARVSIPDSELRFTVSRSGGPGGQHVNKVSTRVTLEFEVDASPSLSDAQKTRIHERLGPRLTRDGRLRLSCGLHRSQTANRREVRERFERLLDEALRPRRRRVPTAVSRAARARRLEEKAQRGRVKRARRSPGRDD